MNHKFEKGEKVKIRSLDYFLNSGIKNTGFTPNDLYINDAMYDHCEKIVTISGLGFYDRNGLPVYRVLENTWTWDDHCFEKTGDIKNKMFDLSELKLIIT